MSPDQGSFVLAQFDWSPGIGLRLEMVASTTIYGAVAADPRQSTRDASKACRWQSRQAARQAMRRLRARLILDDRWRVVNLRSLGSG